MDTKDTEVARKLDDGTWETTMLSLIKAGDVYSYPVSPEIEYQAVHDAFRRPDIGKQLGGWTTNKDA